MQVGRFSVFPRHQHEFHGLLRKRVICGETLLSDFFDRNLKFAQFQKELAIFSDKFQRKVRGVEIAALISGQLLFAYRERYFFSVSSGSSASVSVSRGKKSSIAFSVLSGRSEP